MRKTRKKGKITTKAIVALVIVIIVVASALVLFKGKREEKEKEEAEEGIELVIITRHDSTIWDAYEEAFLNSEEAKRLGVTKIRWLGPPPTLWVKTISSSDHIDIAWGGGPTLFDQLASANVLMPIEDPETLKVIDEIPDEIAGAPMKRYVNGKLVWVASAIASFGFTINEDFLNKYNLPKPKVWEDLGCVEYAKILPIPTVAFAKPTMSTSHTRIYEIILQKFGWEKGWEVITRLAANGIPTDGSVEAQSKVDAGEVGVSISIDFYGYTSGYKNPACSYVLPFNESIVNGDPIALTVKCKHKEAALAFIRFVLSKEGQSLWLSEKINRMPVRADAFDTELGRKRADLKKKYEETLNNIGIKFDDEEALSIEYVMRIYLEATLIDVHSELVETWKAIVKAFLDGKITEEEFNEYCAWLGKPVSWVEDGKTYTFTEEFAKSINERISKDPEFQSKMRSLWREAALKKYKEIRESLPS